MKRAELFRAGVLAVIAVLVLASYEIVRPAAESIFVAEHGVEALPKAWLAIAATPAAEWTTGVWLAWSVVRVIVLLSVRSRLRARTRDRLRLRDRDRDRARPRYSTHSGTDSPITRSSSVSARRISACRPSFATIATAGRSLMNCIDCVTL